RVDLAVNVHHIGVFENANHLGDCRGLSNVGQELVAEAFTLRSAFHNTGDIYEVDGGRQELLGTKNLCEFVETLIRQVHNADVGVDGRERVVRGKNRLAGEGIK